MQSSIVQVMNEPRSNGGKRDSGTFASNNLRVPQTGQPKHARLCQPGLAESGGGLQ